MEREEIIEFCEMKAELEPENEDLYNYIIEALKQEPCEDAVSREAVLKEIPRLWNSKCDKDYCMETLRDFVSELPHVTPKGVTVTDFADKCRECGKQKKGKWLIKASGFPPEPMTVCSECGFDKDFYIRNLTFDKLKYCPICGAKMEVEE